MDFSKLKKADLTAYLESKELPVNPKATKAELQKMAEDFFENMEDFSRIDNPPNVEVEEINDLDSFEESLSDSLEGEGFDDLISGLKGNSKMYSLVVIICGILKSLSLFADDKFIESGFTKRRKSTIVKFLIVLFITSLDDVLNCYDDYFSSEVVYKAVVEKEEILMCDSIESIYSESTKAVSLSNVSGVKSFNLSTASKVLGAYSKKSFLEILNYI